MPVFLKVKDGDRFRDVAVLVPGEPVTIGRTDASDLKFPEDSELSSRHASVEIRDGKCIVKDLRSTNGTRLNEEPIETAEVSASDVIRCGGIEFTVEWSTERSSSVDNHPAKSKLEPKPDQPVRLEHPTAVAAIGPAEPGEHLTQLRGFTGETAAEIIKRFDIPPDSIPIQPEEGETPQAFTQRLLDVEEPPTASLTFLASALPKRCAVWWLIECVRQSECFKADGDEPMLAAAEKWVRDPSDENRRAAYSLAEELEMETPASWTGVAAFYSDGSMGPPDVPPVPPGEDLTGKAVNGGITIAAYDDPANLMKRKQAYTELGLKIAAGEFGWDDE